MRDPKTKKILLVTPSFGAGGAERQIARLATHLDPLEFDVFVAQFRGGGTYGSAVPPIGRHQTLCSVGAKSSTVAFWGSIWPLIKMLRELRPDVVHANQNHSNLACAVALALARVGSSLVLGVQNNYEEELKQCRLRPRRLWTRMYRWALERASSIVCLSQGVRSDLVKLLPHLGEKTVMIYNAGLDDKALKDSWKSLQNSRERGPLVVTCGRLSPQKDHATLLSSFREVHQQIPAARLWVLGEGPLRSELEALSKRMGLQEVVQFIGFQANPFPFMAAADLFVLSSRFEGFANVLVEAMACGVAVLSTDCAHGPREIIQHEVNGVLVPVGDAAAMGTAMVRLLRDDSFRAQLSIQGRERAKTFSAANSAAEYAKLFKASCP